jgi:hypothetical protein
MQTRLPLTGQEQLSGAGAGDGTLLDFWRWAFGDLRLNDVRGVFGEWLVAQLLGMALPPRSSWDAYDLVTRKGIKIEVKTTAFIQAWRPDRPTKAPSFGGLCGRCLNPDTCLYADQPTYNADLYVFCLQIETDAARWDALDLAQWRFFLLTRDVIEQRGCKSLSLSALRTFANEMTATEFQAAANAFL